MHQVLIGDGNAGSLLNLADTELHLLGHVFDTLFDLVLILVETAVVRNTGYVIVPLLAGDALNQLVCLGTLITVEAPAPDNVGSGDGAGGIGGNTHLVQRAVTAAIGEALLFCLVEERCGTVEEGVQSVDHQQIGETDVHAVTACILHRIVVVRNGGKNTVDDFDSGFFHVGGMYGVSDLAQISADHLTDTQVLDIPVLRNIGIDCKCDDLIVQFQTLCSLQPSGIELFEIFTLECGKLKKLTINISSHYFASLILSTKLSSLVVRGAMASREYS